MSTARTIPKSLRAASPVLAAILFCGIAHSANPDPAVTIAPIDSASPRQLEDQTKAAIIHDYLLAWQSLGQTMQRNQPELLDGYFVGTAKDRLTATVLQQCLLGIQTSYRDRSHNIKIVFYSPDGRSIQLLDDVEYDVAVSDRAKPLQGAEHVRTRYIAVLTPTESKWKVRIFQNTN